MFRRLVPPVAAVAASTAAVSGVMYSAGDTEVRERADSAARILRTVSTGAMIAADYKLWMWTAEFRDVERDTEQWKEGISAVHERSAARLLRLCERNGGIYTKWGQYVGSMSHVLPKEYSTHLKVLQDSVTPRPWADVQRTLEQDFGSDVATMFRHIDAEPIAAASLAQVHRATTLDGQDVAVKVQYPGLQRQMHGDLWTMRTLLRVVGKAFPAFEFSWMLPEFEKNLIDELDFRKEANNAAEIAALLSDRSDVYIPATVQALSSSRVHTMEFIDGVKVTDLDGLRGLDIDPADIATTVSSTFGDMTFCHGLVHCDPHPGNLLVRRSKATGAPQLVILDHGMYRRLDGGFRAAYCRLWQALILRDDDLLHASARELGIGQYAELLPFMFSYRSAAQKAKMKKAAAEPNEKVLGRKYTMSDLNDLFASLPRDMLFVLRTLDLSRSVNIALGGTSPQRFRINAECAIKGLSLEDPDSAQSLQSAHAGDSLASTKPSRRQRLVAAVKRKAAMAELKMRVWFIDMVFSWIWWWAAVTKG